MKVIGAMKNVISAAIITKGGKRKFHKALKRKVKCEECGAKYTEFFGVDGNKGKKYQCIECYHIMLKRE